ncbi:MAG: phytanoyl-CoA dioxygenase family protein [Chloroflexota bacterium]
MNISELQAKVAHLEQELQETRDLLSQANQDPEAMTADLVRTRAYAFDPNQMPTEDAVAGCVASLDRYGFCVIDNVIPRDEVEAVRDEIVAGQDIANSNVRRIKEIIKQEGLNEQELLDHPTLADGVELRPVRRVGLPPKPPNDIVWMPRFAQHLADPVVTAVARQVLDDHLRIAQLHPRIIQSDKADGTQGGFGAVEFRGRADSRRWHTDWPHDLSAYGGGNAGLNAGCIRQPFPDITMCLVMIWYLTDVDADSGGTWIVPGSHKDKRNPRGPSDGISVAAPIPGDMQVSASAGSVFIQDSRSWHASPAHNPSDRARVAVVTRWCPWWLSVDDYAPGGTYNMICRPISHAEYLALPTDLQPLMRHLCPDEQDVLQQPVLDRAHEAALRNQAGFRQLAEADPDELARANAHVRVLLRPEIG